jgi:hypothetical protein
MSTLNAFGTLEQAMPGAAIYGFTKNPLTF